MIRNGYYFPQEIWKKLVYEDENGDIQGEATIGISMGTRSGGKTCGFIQYLLRDFFDYGNCFVLIARDEERRKHGYAKKWFRKFADIESSKDEETNRILEELKNHEIKYDNDGIYIDNEQFCACVALSTSAKAKDVVKTNNVTKIIYDECVQKGETYQMILGQNAMERLWDILVTVARGDENAWEKVSIVFIFNVSEFENWIFDDLNIREFFDEKTKFTCQHEIVIEKVSNEIQNNKVINSRMGKVMARSKSGRAYLERNFKNEYSDDSKFIKKIGLDFKNIVYNIKGFHGFMGIFKTQDGFHASWILEDDRGKKVALDASYIDEEYTIKDSYQILEILRRKYGEGKMTFQDQRSKNNFLKNIGYS